MAQKSIEMNLAKQVQQLRNDGVPIKEIVRRIGVSRKTVKKYLRLMEQSPQSDGINDPPMPDKELATIIYNNDVAPIGGKRLEDLIHHFDYAKKELHKTGVNKQILWLEYLDHYPEGYKYSQYCNLLTRHLKNTDPAFHWEYNPGEFTQVDFAGKKLSYVNRETGEIITCEVFVAILPYSGLIFCIAVLSQKTADFACCINEMVKYIGGVTKTNVVDNLRTAVTKADKFEPTFTELCYQLSDHYNTTFSATRPYSATDKAMVEKAVDIVYTNIYAPMRKEIFGSLEELNRHIRKWLKGVEIVELNFQIDHIHVVCSIPPRISVSELLGILKSKLAIKLFKSYPKMKEKPYWGNHFWSRGYFVTTVGADEEITRRYVKYQEGEDKKEESQSRNFDLFSPPPES